MTEKNNNLNDLNNIHKNDNNFLNQKIEHVNSIKKTLEIWKKDVNLKTKKIISNNQIEEIDLVIVYSDEILNDYLKYLNENCLNIVIDDFEWFNKHAMKYIELNEEKIKNNQLNNNCFYSKYDGEIIIKNSSNFKHEVYKELFRDYECFIDEKIVSQNFFKKEKKLLNIKNLNLSLELKQILQSEKINKLSPVVFYNFQRLEQTNKFVKYNGEGEFIFYTGLDDALPDKIWIDRHGLKFSQNINLTNDWKNKNI